jgi:hypothetical protein
LPTDRLTADPVLDEPGTAVTDAAHDEPSNGAAPAPRPRRLGRWLTVAALLAAPVVVFYALRVMPFFTQNGVDPFIYVGYQQSLGDLIERFGYSYYFPVRFGLLLPMAASSWAFGAVPGYFVARYLLALLAAVALYSLGRSYGSRTAGWLGALACLCSPVFLGALMTMYTDTVAVPCLVGGLVLLLMPSTRARPLRALVAGLLFGLAFNTNLFIGPLLVAAFACRAVLHVLRREWFAFVEWVIVAVGVVLVTALGALYYGLAFGDPDVLTPSIDAARLYSGDAGLVFRAPDHRWLGFSPHLYIPGLVGLALLLTIVVRRRVADESWLRRLVRPGAADALALLGGAQLFFVLHQFVLDGYSMEAYYYYSFLWPFTMVALVMVGVEARSARSFGARGLAAAAAVAVLVPVVKDLAWPDLEVWPSTAVPVLAGVVALGVVAARFVPWAAWVGVLVLVLGVSLLAVAPPQDVELSPNQNFRWDPHYELMTGSDDTTGLSYYRAAAQLADLVPRWEDDPGSTLYWYRNDDIGLNHVQSSGLWRGATIDLGGSQYPDLPPETVRLLEGRTPRHVVVLGRTARQVGLGEDALGRVIQPLSVRRATIGDDVMPVHVAILTYDAAPCDQDWRTRVDWAKLDVCR